MDRDEHERKKADEETGRQGRAELSFSPHISGESNVVAGRDININKRETVRTVVKPGPEHITPKLLSGAWVARRSAR